MLQELSHRDCSFEYPRNNLYFGWEIGKIIFKYKRLSGGLDMDYESMWWHLIFDSFFYASLFLVLPFLCEPFPCNTPFFYPSLFLVLQGKGPRKKSELKILKVREKFKTLILCLIALSVFLSNFFLWTAHKKNSQWNQIKETDKFIVHKFLFTTSIKMLRMCLRVLWLTSLFERLLSLG